MEYKIKITHVHVIIINQTIYVKDFAYCSKLRPGPWEVSLYSRIKSILISLCLSLEPAVRWETGSAPIRPRQWRAY